jgi:hypothetical protein
LSRVYPSIAFALLLLTGSLVGGFSVNSVHAQVAPHPNLFVSAENSQYNNYFAGPQVIQVVVSDPDINRLDQFYGEPVVTVNGKRLRMAQATDGNWYAYLADRNQAEAAANTAVLSGHGLNFGGFCGPASTLHPKTLVDYTQTKGFTIARGGYGSENKTTAPGGKITSVNLPICSIPSAPATAGQMEHVVRENKTLNTNPAGFAASGDYENIWPVIQLYDFSAIPTPVAIDYSRAGGDQIVNLTFDRIPQNLISVTPDRVNYPDNAQVFLTMNDPQLNIDPTEEDSWTWGANGANSTLYYQAFNRNGAADADGTIAMQNLIGNLTTFMFNHNGKFTLNPTAQTVRVVDLQTNGKEIITPPRGDPAIVSTKSIGPNSEPITFSEVGGVNAGVFGNWDGGKKSNLVTTNNENIRGESATLRYNNISTAIVGGFSFGTLNMNIVTSTSFTGKPIQVTLLDNNANKNSKITEHLDVSNPDVQRVPTMVIGNPFDLSSGGPGKEVAQYYTALPAVMSSNNGTVTLGPFSKLANATNLSQDESISARPIFNATGTTPFTISDTGGLLVDLKTNVGMLRGTIHDPRPGNAEHFKGFNFFNYDVNSIEFQGSTYPITVKIFLVYNTQGWGILGNNNTPLTGNHYFNLVNSSSLGEFVNLNQTVPGVVDSNKLNSLLFSNKIPNSASLGLLFSFGTTGDTLKTRGQPIVADFGSAGILGDGKLNSQRINNAILRPLLEETGDNTGTFVGQLQYVPLNQLNIFDPASYGPAPFGIPSPVRFAAIQDMLQSLGTAPTVSYLDLGADGVNTILNTQQDIPTHSGKVSLDLAKYKIGQTATVTLDDQDLNTNNELVLVYTTVPNGADPAADTVGVTGLGTYSNGDPFGSLVSIKWEGIPWKNTCFGASDLTKRDYAGDLFGTGFALVETGASTGVFTGTFTVPDQFCDGNKKESTLDQTLTATYFDFRDDSGNLAKVSATSKVLNH